MKTKLLAIGGTNQRKRTRQHRCRCMAQCAIHGSYYCYRNAVCYKDNPLHIKWWNHVKGQ